MQREHDAGAGRDAFAAAETVEHRIQMTDEHGERGGGHRPFGRGERHDKPCASNTATKPFNPSPTSVSSAAVLVAGAQDVGRARVARAVLVRIRQTERTRHDDGERDRADEVGADDDERSRKHGSKGSETARR